MSTKFTAHYLLENLRDIYFAERTGSLTLKSGAAWRRLFFDRGMVALADSSEGAENLVPLLAEQGKLSTQQQAAPNGKAVLDVAAHLVSTGVVAPPDLETAARRSVEQVVVGAFRWDGGTFDFQEHPVTPTAYSPDVLFTFNIFMRGVQAMANFEPLKEVLLAQPRRLRLNDNAFLPIQSLSIGARQGYILSRIDGSLTLGEVSLLAPEGSGDEVLRLLFGFLVLGLVLFDPPAGEGLFSLRSLMSEHRDDTKRDHADRHRIMDFLEKTRGKLPQEILGVEPGQNSLVLKKAYESLRDVFNKERFSENLRHELKRELGLIENRLLEAYLVMQTAAIQNLAPKKVDAADVIGNTEMRKELVKSEVQATEEENQREAEKHFLKAKDYFKDADYYNCIQFCKLAVKFNPNEAPFFGLMGDALLHNPDNRWQRLAEESYRKALELDPWNADYLVSLGQLYRRQGLSRRARRHFEMALEILPEHSAARDELSSLGKN
jgi:tetratricopeptide (TPR) repeat protein